MNDFNEKAKTWDSDPIKIARARSVAEGIKANIPLAPNMSVFEYGCGTGLLSFALQPYFTHMTLADSSSGMIAVLEEKIASSGFRNMTTMKLDIVIDPLPLERYHIIYTLMTLHHILDTDKILREFHRLLDTPGYLCVADLDKEDGSFHGPYFSGHKGFDRDELCRKVIRIGFQQVEFTTIFHMAKGEGKSKKNFPLFLMISKK